MCESIPPECLPASEERRASAEPAASQGLRLHLPRLPRRTVLTGLGSVFLAGCMPASAATREARAGAPARSAPRRPRPAPRRRPAYEVVSREQWGAEALKDNHDPMARITRITVHHTAEIAGMQERGDADLVLGIQNFHRNTRGWADIGYHWVIGRDGKVYEGRKLHVQGAHAGASNNIENLGISVIGDFSAALPPPAALRTLTLFLRAQQKRYGIPSTEVFGHREFKATACPGDALFGWVERFRARG